MRAARHAPTSAAGHPEVGDHQVAWTLVESLLALLLVGALLGLGAGFALSRTIDFMLSLV